MTTPSSKRTSGPDHGSPVLSGSRRRHFTIEGLTISVDAPPKAIAVLDEDYAAYTVASPAAAADVRRYRVTSAPPDAARLDVIGPDGVIAEAVNEEQATIALLMALSIDIPRALANHGIFAIHGAALVHRGTAVAIVGPSGAGKTTLALDLVANGLGLLSDELTLSGPEGALVLPFRRAVHIRSGTPALIPALAAVENRPRRCLPGLREWTLLPTELEEFFPGCHANPAPLRHIVFLSDIHGDRARMEPVSSGKAAVELASASQAAVDHFGPTLARTAALTRGAKVVALKGGTPASRRDVLLDWLDG